jgi:hypothetical protein
VKVHVREKSWLPERAVYEPTYNKRKNEAYHRIWKRRDALKMMKMTTAITRMAVDALTEEIKAEVE